MDVAAFNLRHLRALAAAVRSGSLGGAATRLGISQPAVSQAIARLETLAGARLLHRSARGTRATEAGILLGARAEAAGAALAEAFRPARSGGIGGRTGADQDITMAQLTAFLALAESGSYAAGAVAAGVAQPTLHRAVADLEGVCGTALVQRRGRGVVLTEAGERLARAFRLARTELQAAIDELAVLGGRDQGTIRILADAAALDRVVPAALARFLAEHPPVRVEVEDAASDAATRLRDGRTDAIAALRSDGLAGADLSVETLCEVPLVIVGRAGHPIAGGTPGLVRLAAFGWALPPAPSDERHHWERMFLAGGLYPPAPGVTCPDARALLALVATTDLLTVASAARIETFGQKLVQIGEPLPGPRELALATRAGWAPTPAQAAFLDELRTCAATTLAF